MCVCVWAQRFTAKAFLQQQTTLHTTAGFLLKLSRVGPGQQHTTLHTTAGFLLKLSRVSPWMVDQMLLEVVLEGQ
jgi:hypothetical protein